MNKIELSIKEAVLSSLEKINKTIEVSHHDIVIEIPKDATMGDYATNVAMRLSKVFGFNPVAFANLIVEHIEYEKYGIESIVIAGPGFLNIFIDKTALGGVLFDINKAGNAFGSSTIGKGIKYNIEFVSANPTGELHLGTARGAVVGDCISRLLEKAGYDVTREYYFNDAGQQIDNQALSIQSRYHKLFDIDVPMPKDGYYGDDIIEIAKIIKNDIEDKYVNNFSEEAFEFFKSEGIRLQIMRIKAVLNQSRINFDVFYSEADVRKAKGPERIIEQLTNAGYTYTKEGALWFESTKFKDDKDRVLVKSDGSYTYLTPDIAYHLNKYERGFDYLVDVLGADHHGYIHRIKASMMALGYKDEQLAIDIVQVVRLIKNGEELKMSKRTGNAITMKEFIEEVGVDAMRYFYASKAGNTHFDFDIDLATSTSQENPVYYAQYAHARVCSILKKAKIEGYQLATTISELTHPKEIDLIKVLNEFPSLVAEAAKQRMPHKLTNYIQKVAQLFHTFYNECHVLDETFKKRSEERLVLVKAVAITLANALELIGVDAPESM